MIKTVLFPSFFSGCHHSEYYSKTLTEHTAVAAAAAIAVAAAPTAATVAYHLYAIFTSAC
jgi:hypothetical protein